MTLKDRIEAALAFYCLESFADDDSEIATRIDVPTSKVAEVRAWMNKVVFQVDGVDL